MVSRLASFNNGVSALGLQDGLAHRALAAGRTGGHMEDPELEVFEAIHCSGWTGAELVGIVSEGAGGGNTLRLLFCAPKTAHIDPPSGVKEIAACLPDSSEKFAVSRDGLNPRHNVANGVGRDIWTSLITPHVAGAP